MKIKFILMALLALLFASCHQGHEHESESEHQEHDDHEEVKIQFTAYSENFELFAEADPFVVGETANVLSHFSHLSDFKALQKGSITIRLLINGNEINQILDQPTRKGIYSFDIQPVKAGLGQLLFDIKTNDGVFQVVVPNIKVYQLEEEAHAAAEGEIISKTNTTVFTKEQSWKIDFGTALPLTEPFGQVIKTTAHVQSAPTDELIITAKTNGFISLSSNQILEGQSVSKGQILFSISGNDLADNNSTVRFLEAKNNYEKAKSDYERIQTLAADKIISDKELLNAKYQYDNAQLIFDNLNENFSASGQNVLSLKTGFIKQLFVQNGEYVEAGQSLVSISRNEKLLLRADVQQKYSSALGAITTANIHTLENDKTFKLEELNGKIVSYGRSANTDNFLIPVFLEVDKVDGLIPGCFVEVFLKTQTNSNALTIPVSALLEEQGHFFVFVQINPELFEKREVKCGVTDGLKIEIIEGVTSTDRIVTLGALMVKLAKSTGTLDAHSGHVH